MMLRLLALLVLALLAAATDAFVVPCGPGQAAVRAAQRQQGKAALAPVAGRSSRQGLVKCVFCLSCL